MPRRGGHPRDLPGFDYLYGRNPVLEALRAGRRVHRLLIADSASGTALQEVLREAQRQRVEVFEASRPRLDDLVGEHHQGVVAEAAAYGYRELDDLLAIAAGTGTPPLLLVLDSLQDPQNLGTLLRAALAAGVSGVVIPEHRAASVTPAVSKASAGAVEHLAVARVTNLTRTLLRLKELGMWVYGLDQGGQQPFWEVDWRGPSALVVGSEGTGISRLVRDTCDALVTIPMAENGPESLNAATAGSLVVYEAFRQRREPRP